MPIYQCQSYQIKNIKFQEADLTQAQIFKTSFNCVDLSQAKIDGLSIALEDIKGATISQVQVLDLMYLLGVKIK